MNKNEESTILIVGGTSYLGAHIACELIKRNKKILTVDEYIGNFSKHKTLTIKDIQEAANSTIPFIQTSYSNKEILKKIFKEHQIETVIDCTGFTTEDKVNDSTIDYMHKCLSISIDLLYISKKYNCKKYIYISSTHMYDYSKDAYAGSLCIPYSSYTQALLAVEQIVEHYSSKDFKCCILRCSTILGTHPSYKIGDISNNFLNQFYDLSFKKINDLQFNTNSKSKEKFQNNFIHVQDTCNAIVNSIDFLNKSSSGSCRIFNIASCIYSSLQNIYETWIKANNYDIDLNSNLLNDKVTSQAKHIDTKTAEQELHLKITKNLNAMCHDAFIFRNNQKKYFSRY